MAGAIFQEIATPGLILQLTLKLITTLYFYLQVKEYIRSAKQWRNDKWPESESGSGRPSSYFLSLLVVAAYEQNPYKYV